MPPIDEAALAAAMDAGIAEANGTPPTPAPAAPAAGEPNDTSADTSGADGADAGAGDDKTDADGHASGAGVPGADGAAVPAVVPPTVPPGDGAAVLDADGKPIVKVGDPATPEVKAPDPLNDPLPNALKKETKERITTLVTMVKDLSTKEQQATSERNEILNAVLDTGSTPQQYGAALNYLKLVNSDSRIDKEQALTIMQAEVAVLARALGKPVPGVNLLEGHDDLIQEVGSGRLSPERATEIAAAREARKIEVAVSGRRTEQQRTGEQQAAVVRQGVSELNALELRLKASEPAVFAAKRAILINALKPVFKQIHPSQWADTFQRAYNELPAPAPRPTPPPPAVLPGAAPTGGGGNTPLRASNPAGGQQPAPKSMQEAIEAGIQAAR